MAVTSCRYMRAAFSASYDRRNMGTYKGAWIVETDGSGASGKNPRSILNACTSVTSPDNAVPEIYDTYDYQGGTDSYAYAQHFEIRPNSQNRQNQYRVDVTWSPLPEGKQADDLNTNPLLRGVEYSFDWEVYTDIVEEDKDGKQIVNSAGKPFDINVEMERSRTVLVASYNVATFASIITLSRTYQDAVNSSTWLGAPARSVLCRNVQSSGLITEPGGSYYRVTFRFAFRDEGKTWDERLLSRGFGYLKEPNDFDTYTTEDRNEEELVDTLDEPLLLKADGTPVDPGGAPHYMTYRVRREANFNTLPI